MKYLIAILLIAGAGGWWWFIAPDDSSNNTLTPAQALLIKIGDKCAGIAENAIANQTSIVEFQKLELLSKRTTVLTNCMHDNGYNPNPAWLKYAQPIVQASATEDKISYDEALANFSRSEMQLFAPNKSHPIYWAKTN